VVYPVHEEVKSDRLGCTAVCDSDRGGAPIRYPLAILGLEIEEPFGRDGSAEGIEVFRRDLELPTLRGKRLDDERRLT
jgi:hypothetical protein